MTVIAELKVIVEQAAPELTLVFAQGENVNPHFPYASIFDPISNAVQLQGDAQTLAHRRMTQVDLWQREGAYDEGIVDRVVGAIDGHGSQVGIRYRVENVVLVAEDDDVIHHSVTVTTPVLR